MPIRPENRGRYPADWQEVRARILTRAGHCCEWCGVPQYAVGYRDESGRFAPNAGNLHCDASGQGEHPNGEPLTYAEAREFADLYNDCVGAGGAKCDDDGRRWVVIVLTVAHVENPDPSDCRDENLAALCQRCHNRHDLPMRGANAHETRRRQAERVQPVLTLDA